MILEVFSNVNDSRIAFSSLWSEHCNGFSCKTQINWFFWLTDWAAPAGLNLCAPPRLQANYPSAEGGDCQNWYQKTRVTKFFKMGSLSGEGCNFLFKGEEKSQEPHQPNGHPPENTRSTRWEGRAGTWTRAPTSQQYPDHSQGNAHPFALSLTQIQF